MASASAGMRAATTGARTAKNPRAREDTTAVPATTAGALPGHRAILGQSHSYPRHLAKAIIQTFETAACTDVSLPVNCHDPSSSDPYPLPRGGGEDEVARGRCSLLSDAGHDVLRYRAWNPARHSKPRRSSPRRGGTRRPRGRSVAWSTGIGPRSHTFTTRGLRSHLPSWGS